VSTVTSDRKVRRALADLALAVAFLTIVPVPATGHGDADLGRAGAWFPLVGAAVGAFAGGIRVATDELLGPGPATVLALIALVAVTGALHQDGLADTADGLGVRHDRTRRLAAMRDSATGVFGVLAVTAWALLLVTTLAQLDATKALLALVAAGALSRWAALLHARGTPPARQDGLGTGFHAPPAALAAATVLALAAAELAAGPLPGLAAIGATLLTAAASIAAARKAIGGRTGDTLGATVAVAEVAVCLTLLACWR
jgi:adenosylcobinamide-GDP ribazoletransferase